MRLARRIQILVSIAAPLALAGGCARVAIEGGEKPIKIDMTITHKVDRELDQFFAFQQKYEAPATAPAAPATQPAVVAPTAP